MIDLFKINICSKAFKDRLKCEFSFDVMIHLTEVTVNSWNKLENI